MRVAGDISTCRPFPRQIHKHEPTSDASLWSTVTCNTMTKTKITAYKMKNSVRTIPVSGDTSGYRYRPILPLYSHAILIPVNSSVSGQALSRPFFSLPSEQDARRRISACTVMQSVSCYSDWVDGSRPIRYHVECDWLITLAVDCWSRPLYKLVPKLYSHLLDELRSHLEQCHVAVISGSTLTLVQLT